MILVLCSLVLVTLQSILQCEAWIHIVLSLTVTAVGVVSRISNGCTVSTWGNASHQARLDAFSGLSLMV